MKYYVVSSQQLLDLLESGRVPSAPENALVCRECASCQAEAAEVAARYGFEEVEDE